MKSSKQKQRTQNLIPTMSASCMLLNMIIFFILYDWMGSVDMVINAPIHFFMST